ncbi:MAG: family transposase [Candidatus Sulfotelmatobacter sp.]|nr:family transposase [Candidatus Sulfotelmatobacter sp.]
MELVHPCCAGLDVHKKSVSACIRIRQGNTTITETAMFGTFTRDLERLRDWVRNHKVKEVAMESTGVFWIPVWNVLERAGDGALELTLINPQHARALPGRKSDRLDCERIAELHQYGLLQGSFIPPAAVRELRDVTRRQVHLQQERNRAVNRIARLLETVNIKLGSVVSDLTGKTAQLMLEAIARGDCDPEELVKLAQASLKNKKELLKASLEGFSNDHFRWLLSEALRDLKLLDGRLEHADQRIAQALRPHADLVLRLCSIPGFDFTAAATVLAEVGFDMQRFEDPAHLASWAGLCPGCNESAGKRTSSRTRKGYLRRLLAQSAWSILRKKNCFLTALFFRIASRGGQKKAAMAVAHRILTIVWHVIAEGGIYKEIGTHPADRRNAGRMARRLARRLAQLGFPVELKSQLPSQARIVDCKPANPVKPPKPKFQKTLVRRKPRAQNP